MNLNVFKEVLRKRPFEPFRLVMSSGESYEVRHPEMAFLTRSDVLVGLDETRDGVPSRFRICALLHVSAIEPISDKGNGARRRKGRP